MMIKWIIVNQEKKIPKATENRERKTPKRS